MRKVLKATPNRAIGEQEARTRGGPGMSAGQEQPSLPAAEAGTIAAQDSGSFRDKAQSGGRRARDRLSWSSAARRLAARSIFVRGRR